jgi:nitroimidazol reductase NimA-like FMN-containing flavoprotein (pyridoxamine 5'-phosphate oxidase superfamily)
MPVRRSNSPAYCLRTGVYGHGMVSDPGAATPSAASAAPPQQVQMLELDRTECMRLLAANVFGRLAVVMATGVPVIRPVNYVFDERSQSVVFRTAVGSKLHALLRSAKAAFEIDGIESSSRSGWSVIIAGVTERITSQSEIRRLSRLGLDPWVPHEPEHWFRIRAYTVSGRRLVAAGAPAAAT